MEKKPMNIAVSLNQKYFYYTYVMLTSLFENNTDSEITVYVMHSDLTEEQIASYRELAAKYGGVIRPVFIDKGMFPAALPTTAEWSIEAYYRLAMPELLPEEAERLLYLDADVIVNGNIRELYDMDFEDKLFVVCKEETANDLAHAPELRIKMFSELFEQGFCYFNSGVMLWNLKEVRKKYRLSVYMELAKQMNYTFVAPDQDILNYCHWNQVKYADADVYDRFARLAHNQGKDYEYVKEHVRILHFTGTKPWNADGIHFDIEQLWWDYAGKTPYYAQLLGEFTRKTINDPFVENYIRELYDHSNVLQANLNDSLSLNEQFLALLGQR